MVRHVLAVVTAAVLVAACQGQGSTPGALEGTAGGDTPGGTAAGAGAEIAAAAPAPQQVAADGVTVTGDGRVSGQPDTLRATVGVEVLRPDVDQAFDDATAAADRVLTAVREAGVDDDDIQTREFSVRPHTEHRPDAPPEVTGYAVRNLVEVTIRDVDGAGELLAAVAEAAGDDARIEGLRFALEDNDAQLEAARAEAFADARAKAEHYAELAGAELGELVSVREVGAELPPPVPFAAEGAARDARAAPIMPGEQEVGVQVQARWSLR